MSLNSRIRVTALAVAAAVAVTAGPVPAGAQPVAEAPTAPGSVPGVRGGEDLEELARLSEEAGALGEEIHLARADLDRANAEREHRERAAGVAAGRAVLADLAAARDQSLVDDLASMRYRGGGTGATRAAVLAESPRDLVDRLGALQRLSGASTSALEASRDASEEATRLRGEASAASGQARDAAADAQRRTDELDARSAEMSARVEEVRRRVDALTEAERALWAGGPVMPPGYVPPPVDGVNGAALRVALSRIGAPYSWGATGPSEFDCSGLMVWSYAQEGKGLPRSSQAQAGGGLPVARADIQPGDLVIYYGGATHVGMYAGDGMVVHASDYGIPVKLDPVDSMPIHSIRRY